MSAVIPVFPPGFPSAAAFTPAQLKEQKINWEFHRDPGSGGKDFGEDYLAPDDSIVVGFQISVVSENHTKGHGDLYLILQSQGVLQKPRGLHIGHRLEPDSIIGAGATFKGEATMQIVSFQDWLPKAIGGI